MVSLLWKACSEGDIHRVQELLDEPTRLDIELKGEYPQLYIAPLGLAVDGLLTRLSLQIIQASPRS